jgi:hypothetical protein
MWYNFIPLIQVLVFKIFLFKWEFVKMKEWQKFPCIPLLQFEIKVGDSLNTVHKVCQWNLKHVCENSIKFFFLTLEKNLNLML